MHVFNPSIVAIWLALVVGWVLNIITIVNTDTLTFTGLMLLRIIGIFVAPLGGVLGLFF